MIIAHISVGGPTLKISVGGKIHTFEMHPHSGPFLLTRRGTVAVKQPMKFLEAVTHWCQQGKRMEGNLCRWDHPPETITKHMGGRHYKVIGYTEPRRGE